MIVDDVQRWDVRRERRRPAGETIRTADYEVAPIADSATAREFVKCHHYSGSASSTAHRFGLYRHADLVGVALFGPPASMAAHNLVFPGLMPDQAVTLGRLVLHDAVEGNGESWFVSQCFALLARRGVIAVESCADPEPRTSLDGTRVFPGHLGIIYQALNGRYLGRTAPASLRLLPDGTVLSNRAQGKLVRGERGSELAAEVLVKWGANPMRPGDDSVEWLRKWREKLTRKMRHRGCHRYVWAIDRRHWGSFRRGPDLQYPKFRVAP